MSEVKEIAAFLDKELKITEIKDHCENGLQVEGKSEIKNIGLSVDVTMNVIKQAVEQKCDLIISHHSLIWQPVKRFTGLLAKRLKKLLVNDISLYVVHLPLDVHRKFSHGRLIADELGLYGLSDFAESGGNFFGFSGNLRKKVTLDQLKENIDKKLETNCIIYEFGVKEVSKISIVSGSGGFAIEQGRDDSVECFITGEMKHADLLKAKDLGINVILAGHYETEKLGMVKLGRQITKKFKIQTLFLES